MPVVLTESRDRAFVVTINRPEARNAVNAEVAQLLFEAVETFKADDALDALILTGAGGVAFCAGADLKGGAGLMARPGSQESGPMGFSRVTDVQKPNIAAVNARLVTLTRRWGVPLLDGGTQRLPRIVGLGNALYLMETGVMINARQAQGMGLVQEVVPEGAALERALELARAISTYPQLSLRNDRRAAIDGLTLPPPEGLQLERRARGGGL